jgi:hypothetical protein
VLGVSADKACMLAVSASTSRFSLVGVSMLALQTQNMSHFKLIQHLQDYTVVVVLLIIIITTTTIIVVVIIIIFIITTTTAVIVVVVIIIIIIKVILT